MRQHAVQSDICHWPLASSEHLPPPTTLTITRPPRSAVAGSLSNWPMGTTRSPPVRRGLPGLGSLKWPKGMPPSVPPPAGVGGTLGSGIGSGWGVLPPEVVARVTSDVSASLSAIAMTRKLPGVCPAVYRPVSLISPPAALNVTSTATLSPLSVRPKATNWRFELGAIVAEDGRSTRLVAAAVLSLSLGPLRTITWIVSAWPPRRLRATT